jgi:hypothetical protein
LQKLNIISDVSLTLKKEANLSYVSVAPNIRGFCGLIYGDTTIGVGG